MMRVMFFLSIFSFLHAKDSSFFKKDLEYLENHWNRIENHTVRDQNLINEGEKKIKRISKNMMFLEESSSSISKKKPSFSSRYLPSHYRWRGDLKDHYKREQYDFDSRKIAEKGDDSYVNLKKKHTHLFGKILKIIFGRRKKDKKIYREPLISRKKIFRTDKISKDFSQSDFLKNKDSYEKDPSLWTHIFNNDPSESYFVKKNNHHKKENFL